MFVGIKVFIYFTQRFLETLSSTNKKEVKSSIVATIHTTDPTIDILCILEVNQKF